MKFSVLQPVYYKDKPEWLALALESILKQTLLPNEVVIIQDGKISNDLKKILLDFQKKIPCQWCHLKKNEGLATALNVGIKKAKYDWLSRMDADDINLPDRYKKQVEFLKKNPQVDLLGGYCLEFSKNYQGPYKQKELPHCHKNIYKLLKKRNSINHVSIFINKEAIKKVGGYESYFGMEDYHLWVKMCLAGFNLCNIQEPLVLQRGGEYMLSKRGGWKYFLEEIRLHSFFLKKGFINVLEFTRNILIRLFIRTSPPFIIKKLYNQIRKEVDFKLD